ncbi:hypothetical protein [Xanthomonas campestris]|uniref:hypothetical protein n=1 Tax=Xanthomonas campestris TaxID=339 RepID=UPI00236750C7|nr:hypothetical protein [Xanthomonas campestris]WDI91960.1 hypothetical protein JH280_11480 [Xanthomonas campestris]
MSPNSDIGASPKELQKNAINFQCLDIEQVKSVQIRRAQTTTRTYDCIRIFVAGAWFSADLVSDRDIRLAKRLADSHGADFGCDEINADRVKRVLEGKS